MKTIQLLFVAALLAAGVACGYGSNYNSMPGTGAGAPAISELSPNDTGVGGANFVLTVNGSNFSSASVVYFNGTPEATNFISASQLAANIPASAIAMSGTISVYVRSGAQNSAMVNFTVNQ